jgi:hypothetical protein
MQLEFSSQNSCATSALVQDLGKCGAVLPQPSPSKVLSCIWISVVCDPGMANGELQHKVHTGNAASSACVSKHLMPCLFKQASDTS